MKKPRPDIGGATSGYWLLPATARVAPNLRKEGGTRNSDVKGLHGVHAGPLACLLSKFARHFVTASSQNRESQVSLDVRNDASRFSTTKKLSVLLLS
jgi:hypothetical protein